MRAAIVVLLATSFCPLHARADDWLTPAERDFFGRYSVPLFVNRSPVNGQAPVTGDAKAKNAPEPLRTQILDYLAAQRALDDANRDQRAVGELHAKAIGELMPQLPDDPTKRKDPEFEKTYLDVLSKNPSVTAVWAAECDRLERGLKAFEARSSHLSAILNGVEKRVGRMPSAPPFRIEVREAVLFGGYHLWIVGTPGSAFTEGAILEILIHTTPARGTWNPLFRHKNVGFWWTGNARWQRAQAKDPDEGARLTALQEQAKDRPSIRTFLTPPIEDRAEMGYDLTMDASLSHYVERIEIRGCCKEGAFTIESVPGLDRARKRTLKSDADKLEPPPLEPVAAVGSAPGHGPPGAMAGGPRNQPDPLVRRGARGRERAGGIPLPPPPEAPEFPKAKEVEPQNNRSAPKPDNATTLLYEGSLWKGSQEMRLGRLSGPIELALNRSDGAQSYSGKFRIGPPPAAARNQRVRAPGRPAVPASVSIKPNGDVELLLQTNNGLPSLHEYRGKFIKDDVIEGEIMSEKTAVGTFNLRYVPPQK